ncbi:MAG TPA: crossover junction endodeoxyribonuclease RuvC [Candidatus Paceibacterota bacterium]|nr:crossover junction endodeoxyribonuclease RuvC [Candidatus Paceibacterota bacterium]
MKVLAIDPGYGRCGIAVVERVGMKDALLYSACIETTPELDFNQRLASVAAECERILALHAADCLALEKLFFAKNRTTAMRVAEVRGALLNLAASRNLPVHEYAPSEIKSATTGSGRADKAQIAKMLHLLVKIEKPIRHDDEYDAIAIGLTHLVHSGSLAARSRAQSRLE